MARHVPADTWSHGDRTAVLHAVDTPLEVVTRFGDFNDFWSTFLGGQGQRRRTSHLLPDPTRLRCATPHERCCPSPPTARSRWSRGRGREGPNIVPGLR